MPKRPTPNLLARYQIQALLRKYKKYHPNVAYMKWEYHKLRLWLRGSTYVWTVDKFDPRTDTFQELTELIKRLNSIVLSRPKQALAVGRKPKEEE